VSDGRRWARAALPWRVTLDGVVVATSGEETLLAGTAAAVWEVLDEPLSDDDLAAACQRRYGLDPASSGEAVRALVEGGLCTRT